MKYSSIIFDLDGTLINSLKDLAISSNYALEKQGYKTHPIDAYRYFVGKGAKVLIEKILPENLVHTPIYDRTMELYNEHYQKHCLDHTGPYDGIPELLGFLKGKGFQLAVVSNKPDVFARHMVEEIFGKNIFDVITGKREGIPRKPDPRGALAACAEMGKTPADCIFMGDSSVDMETAIAANMLPAGAVWGFRGRNELQQAGAKILLAQPLDLIPEIKRLN